MRFRAIVELSGKTATGIRVPAEVVEGLGQGRRPPVSVTIGGYTYRSTVGVMGGQFMLPLSAENRTAAGVAAGDEVEVEVELDTRSREVSVPADFAEALSSGRRGSAGVRQAVQQPQAALDPEHHVGQGRGDQAAADRARPSRRSGRVERAAARPPDRPGQRTPAG